MKEPDLRRRPVSHTSIVVMAANGATYMCCWWEDSAEVQQDWLTTAQLLSALISDVVVEWGVSLCTFDFTRSNPIQRPLTFALRSWLPVVDQCHCFRAAQLRSSSSVEENGLINRLDQNNDIPQFQGSHFRRWRSLPPPPCFIRFSKPSVDQTQILLRKYEEVEQFLNWL